MISDRFAQADGCDANTIRHQVVNWAVPEVGQAVIPIHEFTGRSWQPDAYLSNDWNSTGERRWAIVIMNVASFAEPESDAAAEQPIDDQHADHGGVGREYDPKCSPSVAGQNSFLRSPHAANRQAFCLRRQTTALAL